MKRELNLSPEPATIIAELRRRVQDAWDNISQDDIRHLYNRLHARIHACVAAREGTLCIDAIVWEPRYCDICIFFGLNLLSCTPTMINYLPHKLSVQ